jgi:FkbM family methyltransferase
MVSKLLRALPPFKGKQRLSRLLLRSYIARSRDISIEAKYGCTFKVPNTQETVSFELLINGVYEKGTVDFIVQRLDRKKAFIDIGANIGAITVPVSKQCNGIKVICLEAAPWLFEYLQFNVKSNSIPNVTLVNKAISDVGGKQVPFYSPFERFGKGSLAPVFTSDGVMVETTTLTELVGPLKVEEIGFIKIDIEGFEYFAFLGGAEVLKPENAPDILFEFADWAEDLVPGIKAGAAQALLLSYGYRIYYFKDGALCGELTEPREKGSSMFFATKRPV